MRNWRSRQEGGCLARFWHKYVKHWELQKSCVNTQLRMETHFESDGPDRWAEVWPSRWIKSLIILFPSFSLQHWAQACSANDASAQGLWVYLLKCLWFTLWCLFSAQRDSWVRQNISNTATFPFIFILDEHKNKDKKWSAGTLDRSFTLEQARLHPCLQHPHGCSDTGRRCAAFLSTIERVSDAVHQKQHLCWLCVCVCVCV